MLSQKQLMKMGTEQTHQLFTNPWRKIEHVSTEPLDRSTTNKSSSNKWKNVMKQNDQAHPSREHVPQSKKRISVLIFVRYVTRQTYLKISMLVDPSMLPNVSTWTWNVNVNMWNVNTQQNSNLTESWRSMALKVGNEAPLKFLPTGDTSSNELYYHAKCNNDLWNQCIKIDKESRSRNIEKKMETSTSIWKHC